MKTGDSSLGMRRGILNNWNPKPKSCATFGGQTVVPRALKAKQFNKLIILLPHSSEMENYCTSSATKQQNEGNNGVNFVQTAQIKAWQQEPRFFFRLR